MNKKNALRTCPICSTNIVEILHGQSFVLPEGHPLANGYDVVNCTKCGFVYADVLVSQAAYDRFYAQFSKYGDAATSTGSGENPIDLERLKATAKIITTFAPNKNARIVDIGCANGGLLKEFHNLGYQNLLGIDPAAACVENTRKNSSAEALIGSLSTIPANIGKFDVVILSHVLEHVQDLNQAISELAGLLANNGGVYIEVPDATRYADMVIAPFQDFNTEHINHFSLDGLEKLFAKVNLIPVQQGSRTILTGQNIDYPVIHTIFKEGKPDNIIPFDEALTTQIREYIDRSHRILKNIDDRLQNVLQDDPEIIVWGTGQLAMKLLADTCLGKARIIAFVDGNPINQGKVIKGIPIITPGEVRGLGAYPIIITTLLHSQVILNTIHKANLPNPVYTLEVD